MRDKDPTNTSVTQIDFTQFDIENLRDYSREVFDRDLRPYSHDDILYKQMAKPSRLMRRVPELESHVYSALMARDDDSLLVTAANIEHARQQFAPADGKAINTILSYVTLTQATDYIAQSIGGADDWIRVNTLDDLIARHYADAFEGSKLDDAFLSILFLNTRVDEWCQQTDHPAFHAVYAKLTSLEAHLRRRKEAFHYIEVLPETNPSYPSYEQASQDSQSISEWFQHIRASQHFGVKMGYIDDKRGGTFIFSPPIDLSSHPDFADKSYHPLIATTPSVADIIHSRRSHHQRIKQKTEKNASLSVISIDNVEGVVTMCLGPDGELYTDRDCRTSLRDIALQKGKYSAYRDLQATLIAHFYDLTHPLEHVMQAKQASQAAEQSDEQTHPALEPIRRLVIPRVYVSYQQAPPPSDRPSRVVRRHDVTWHTRKLPEGWRASPAAIEFAEQMGVVLGENETIVRDHERGSRLLGEVSAHHFIRRPEELY